MIHEYALEPKLVITWVDRHVGRFFIEKFGLGQPRIVSRYPKRWKKLVWAAFENASTGSNEIERKRMEELVERLGETMVKRRDGRWNSDAAWLDNAEDEHRRVPFAAILARSNPRRHQDVLVADELDDATPLWSKARGQSVIRSASAMATAVAGMLRSARVVIFVDPHFGPEKPRYREPLREFLRVMVDARPGEAPCRIEFHSAAAGSGRATLEYFNEQCAARLPACVPRGLRVAVVRLGERPGGERMHNRYILTELGGVTFGVGLDAGDEGDSDDVQLLDRAQYEERWRQYASEARVFDRPEPPITIVGTSRRRS